MNIKKNPSFREAFHHMTKTEPYSIHQTEFSAKQRSALYLHWHPEVELFYLQDGTLDFFVEDICHHMKAGDAVFVPPNLLHSATACSTGSGTFRALVFSTDLVVSASDATRFRQYVQPLLHNNEHYVLHLKPEINSHQLILKDLERIFSETSAHTKTQISPKTSHLTTDLLVEGLIRVIWQQLYYCHLSELCPNAELEKQIEDVISFIHLHYAEDITLNALAKIAHVSDAQLCRSFKRLTGSTLFTYLKRYRIIKSCELLINSNQKISVICSLCGFSNISYYNREFLKIMKTTPSAYRKLYR